MAVSDPTVEVLLNDIRKEQGRLKKAEAGLTTLGEDRKVFESFFESHAGRYATYGLLCITVMVFDFIVNGRTMIWLARMLHTAPEIIATILTLVDGFLAVQASGIFDAKNPIMMERSKRKWQIILWSLALVKMIAYISFVVMRSSIVNAETGETLSVGPGKVVMMALPQIIFIIVIYSLLHICGSGLWFFLGKAWYSYRQSRLGNPIDIKSKLHKYATDLRNHCEKNGLDYQEIKRQHQSVLSEMGVQ